MIECLVGYFSSFERAILFFRIGIFNENFGEKEMGNYFFWAVGQVQNTWR
jgi:hypothetical protein